MASPIGNVLLSFSEKRLTSLGGIRRVNYRLVRRKIGIFSVEWCSTKTTEGVVLTQKIVRPVVLEKELERLSFWGD